MRSGFFILPNILSISRPIGTLSILLSILFFPLPRFVIFILFLFLCFTDWFDGRIARSMNLTQKEEDWGAFIDAGCDKLFLLPLLWVFGNFPEIWLLLLGLTGIEGALFGIKTWGLKKKMVLSSSIFGKAKTALQMLAVVIFLIRPYLSQNIFEDIERRMFITIPLYVAIGMLAFASALSYFHRYRVEL